MIIEFNFDIVDTVIILKRQVTDTEKLSKVFSTLLI